MRNVMQRHAVAAPLRCGVDKTERAREVVPPGLSRGERIRTSDPLTPSQVR